MTDQPPDGVGGRDPRRSASTPTTVSPEHVQSQNERSGGAGETLTCSKCRASFERPAATGRRPSYCSPGCRRAAEHELQRLRQNLTEADRAIRNHRLTADGLGNGGSPAHARKQVAWWTAELERLEGRLRQLLDDPTTDGDSDDR